MDKHKLHFDGHQENGESKSEDKMIPNGQSGDDGSNGGDASSLAEKEKKTKRRAWLDNIASGKKTLDDMPESLEWLKKDKVFDKFLSI